MGNKPSIALQTILENPDNDTNFKTVFKKYDLDKNSYIDRQEFDNFLKEVMNMVQEEFNKHPDMLKDPSSLSKELVEELMKKKEIASKLSDFDLYDTNKDGKISFEEFKHTIIEISKGFNK